jgi:mannose-6-phosphate isomerase-like protein (cupin superfamily)
MSDAPGHVDLVAVAHALPQAWRSRVVGDLGARRIKIVRMDADAYPEEVHAYPEALLVLEGTMHLAIADRIVSVHAGGLYVVPEGVPHAVAAGSHGALVIIDPP